MTPHRIIMRHKTVGPVHDPYGQETLIVETGTRTAEVEWCGLKGVTLTLTEGKRVVRELHCREYCPATREQVRADKVKARILFRKWVGVDPDDAREEFERSYDPRCELCPN